MYDATLAISRAVQAEFARQIRFESATCVSMNTASNSMDVRSKGDAASLEGVGLIAHFDLNHGDPVLVQGSGWNNMPAVIGKNPFTVG